MAPLSRRRQMFARTFNWCLTTTKFGRKTSRIIILYRFSAIKNHVIRCILDTRHTLLSNRHRRPSCRHRRSSCRNRRHSRRHRRPPGRTGDSLVVLARATSLSNIASLLERPHYCTALHGTGAGRAGISLSEDIIADRWQWRLGGHREQCNGR